MSAEDRSPKGRGPQHTTHHDDCGCLSARYEARLDAQRSATASLEALNRKHAEMYAKEIDRHEARIAALKHDEATLLEDNDYLKQRIAALEAELGECVTKAAGMIGTDAEMAAGPNHGVVLAALDWLHGQKAQLEAERGEWRAAAGREIAIAYAHANALRDALFAAERNFDVTAGQTTDELAREACVRYRDEANAIRFAHPAASLAAHDAEVLAGPGFKLACQVAGAVWAMCAPDEPMDSAACIAIVERALAEQAATHSVPDGTSEVKK